MKYLFLIVVIFIVNNARSQQIEKEGKINHTFLFSAGMFAQTEFGSSYDHIGAAYSLSYQAYFPNRFIIGLYFLSDRASYKTTNKIEQFPSLRKMTGYSAGIQLGFHIVKGKKIDFSITTVPHFNLQEYFIQYYNEKEGIYKEQKRAENLYFVPIMAWRFELYYKFNQTHSLGLTADAHIDMIPLDTDFTILGRLLLTYRVKISRN